MNTHYVLSIVGGNGCYKTKFRTFEAAEKEAYKVLTKYDQDGIRAAHPAIIYGPDFSDDGWTIR
jgi:hypothetical protein